jgi:excisionase family DNA binding protein
MPKTPLTPLSVGSEGAARLMGISRARVYQLKNAGELPFYKDGSRTLFLVADIEARIERLRAALPSTGPLLSKEDQEIARRRAAEPPPPTDQQQPAVEPAPKPSAPDIAAVYAECLRLLAPNGEEEGRLRAFERTVRIVSRDRNCGIDEAKQLVLDAIAKAKEPV